MNRITQYFPNDELYTVEDLDEAKRFDFDGRSFDPSMPLQTNLHRHCDPTPGQWLSEEPVGHNGNDANVTPHVGQ